MNSLNEWEMIRFRLIEGYYTRVGATWAKLVIVPLAPASKKRCKTSSFHATTWLYFPEKSSSSFGFSDNFFKGIFWLLLKRGSISSPFTLNWTRRANVRESGRVPTYYPLFHRTRLGMPCGWSGLNESDGRREYTSLLGCLIAKLEREKNTVSAVSQRESVYIFFFLPPPF